MEYTGTLKSLEELFPYLDYDNIDPSHPHVRVYRGHKVKTGALCPLYGRDNKIDYIGTIDQLLKELISQRPSEFATDKTIFDQLVRAQHYGLPTRLLDISFSPLVALYFAVSEELDQDGELVLIDYPERCIEHSDSVEVSIHANLARLNQNEITKLADLIKKGSKQIDKASKSIWASDVGQVFAHHIRKDFPAFNPDLFSLFLSSKYLVRPNLTNNRIRAQQGGFILYGLHVPSSDSDMEVDLFTINRLCIPSEYKEKLLKQLDQLGIRNSTLFPDELSKATCDLLKRKVYKT